MIKPSDIEDKVFSKSMRGYNAEEVDIFLDDIMLDYEKLIKENNRLQSEIENLNKELLEYKKSESSVLNTLESAKHLMSDISASAEKRAEIILKNARLDAEVIQREAKDSIEKWSEEGEALKKQINGFKLRYKQLLQENIMILDGSTSALLEEMEGDFIPASLDDSEVKTFSRKQEENKSEPAATEAEPYEKSVMDIIMEDMKRSPADNEKQTRLVNVKDDMTKTRIL